MIVVSTNGALPRLWQKGLPATHPDHELVPRSVLAAAEIDRHALPELLSEAPRHVWPLYVSRRGSSLFADDLFSTADPFLNFAGFLFRVP
jgi:hypothetical protein